MITVEERKILRDLAKQVREAAERPEMVQRRNLWYAHNDLKTTDPVIAVFPENAWHECVVPAELQCQDEEARYIEAILKGKLFRANVIDDDVPIEKTWEVQKIITDTGWDKKADRHGVMFANESIRDNCLGGINKIWLNNYKFGPNANHFQPVIMEPKDLDRIQTPTVTYHEKETMEKLKIEQDILGDILPVELVGQKFLYFALMETYTDLRGLEQVMYDIYEEPEMLEDGMQMIADGYHSLLDQYLKYDLLALNNDQGYNGSGGMNYTHDLPKVPGGGKDLKNFWGFCESQEFTMVGPDHHYEFCGKHEASLAERFGLFSYGCCEPVERKLHYILKFNGIRRISISPWADLQSCADQIGQKAVYSWKPNPSLFINNFYDGNNFENYVRNTLEIAKDNCLEIVLKDTGTVNNKPEMYGEFVKLCRRLIDEVRG